MKSLRKRLIGIGLASIMLALVNRPIDALAADSVEILQAITVSDDEIISEDAAVYEGINNCESSALARGKNNITTASLKVTPRSDEILVECITSCTFEADRVGVKDLYVQQKTWYGWKTIAYLTDTYLEDAWTYSFSTHCRSAEKGKTYRVLCTHYAIEEDGTEHIVENKSEEFYYNL